MNKPKVTFYPVGNGCMTLIEIFSTPKRVVLFDMNIKDAADDDSEKETFDVASDFRTRLPKDSEGRIGKKDSKSIHQESASAEHCDFAALMTSNNIQEVQHNTGYMGKRPPVGEYS